MRAENYKGYEIKILIDENPENPRDWDNLGTMVCFHRRYSLGDKHSFASPEEFQEFLKEAKPPVVIALYLLDHSGITMRAGKSFSDVDPGQWDSGLVGYSYVTKEALKKEKLSAQRAREIILGEIKVYDAYISGSVFGYTIEGTELEDSVWGFYDLDDCMKEAKSVIDSVASKIPIEAWERRYIVA